MKIGRNALSSVCRIRYMSECKPRTKQRTVLDQIGCLPSSIFRSTVNLFAATLRRSSWITITPTKTTYLNREERGFGKLCARLTAPTTRMQGLSNNLNCFSNDPQRVFRQSMPNAQGAEGVFPNALRPGTLRQQAAGAGDRRLDRSRQQSDGREAENPKMEF